MLPMIGSADVLIAYWDFGPNAAGYTEQVSINNTVGEPILDVIDIGNSYDSDGQAGTAFIDAEGTTHSAGQALAWGSGVNDGTNQWVISLNLTGYENIALRWDYRSTLSGPDKAVLDYRVGSGDWNNVDTLSFVKDSNFHEYNKDLSSISALNHQTEVELRLSGFSGGSGGGTHRIDNLQITAIPEPAVLSFIALAGAGLVIARRFVH